MTNLPLAAIKRLASVKGKGYRVGEDAVALIDQAASEWIKKVAEESFIFAIHAQRTTLKAVDVIPVLEKMGIKIPVVPVQKPKTAAQKTAGKKKAKKE
jgi:histone H3/H4